jgi:two-component system NtrC family sensor kinase
MFRQGNKKSKNGTKIKILDSYVRFRSSIYGRVVFIISIASIFLFISFWMIFRSVNERYMKSILEENGHNIGSLVEGALYESMLKNDRTSLQNTLDIINRMTGIDDVNMYDNEYNLAYSSISGDDGRHGDPDCKSCHADIYQCFPKKEKAYKIIEEDSECKMSQNRLNGRQSAYKLSNTQCPFMLHRQLSCT